MTMFTIAITVLMVLIALGQLIATIAMLSKSKRIAARNWALSNFDIFVIVLMVSIAVFGLLSFAMVKNPQKWDYYLMSAGMALITVAAALYLCRFVLRYAQISLSAGYADVRRLEERIARLEAMVKSDG